LAAYDATMDAAGQAGESERVESRIRELVRAHSSGEGLAAQVLGRKLGA